jgi:hypothetical protein
MGSSGATRRCLLRRRCLCLIGTDSKDYGLPRLAVGPKSDGLVFIEHAYVRKAHRASVYRSHSGTYGEVNSEVAVAVLSPMVIWIS